MLLNAVPSTELSSQNANSAVIEEPCGGRNEEGWLWEGKKQYLLWMERCVQHLLWV